MCSWTSDKENNSIETTVDIYDLGTPLPVESPTSDKTYFFVTKTY